MRSAVGKELTLQDLSLAIGVFGCALQSTAVFEIENDAVGKLLSVWIRNVRGMEFGKGETLG